MPTRFHCRGCQRPLRISERHLGKVFSCPQCGHQMFLRKKGQTSAPAGADAEEESPPEVAAAEPDPDSSPAPDGELSPETVPAGDLESVPASEQPEARPNLPAGMNPWGLGAASLGGMALILASLLNDRWLPLTVAGLGLAVVAVGLVITRLARGKIPGPLPFKDRAWLTLGGALTGGVLFLGLFAPSYLNGNWVLNRAVARNDPNKQFQVPRDQPEQEGKPLQAQDWVDARNEVIRQDDVVVRLEAVWSGKLDDLGGKTFLQVHLRLTNTGQVRLVKFEGFDASKHPPVLRDDAGRSYAFVEQWPRNLSAKGPATFERSPRRAKQLEPGGLVDALLIFDEPAAGVTSLKLEVPASAWGRAGVCKLSIPREFGKRPPPPEAPGKEGAAPARPGKEGKPAGQPGKEGAPAAPGPTIKKEGKP